MRPHLLHPLPGPAAPGMLLRHQRAQAAGLGRRQGQGQGGRGGGIVPGQRRQEGGLLPVNQPDAHGAIARPVHGKAGEISMTVFSVLFCTKLGAIYTCDSISSTFFLAESLSAGAMDGTAGALDPVSLLFPFGFVFCLLWRIGQLRQEDCQRHGEAGAKEVECRANLVGGTVKT